MLNGLDLFSGIGGITLALSEWVRPVAYCENDRHAQAVLLSRMYSGDLPIAPIWDDVCTLRGNMLPPVDIIYGGFPCQDISAAGSRGGLEGERSGLFFEIMRLVDELRPPFLFLENVAAINVRGLDRVVGEITQRRYNARWLLLSAAEMGAPHLRNRWWLLAHTMRPRWAEGNLCNEGITKFEVSERWSTESRESSETHTPLADTEHERIGRRKSFAESGEGPRDVAHTDNSRELEPEGCQCFERRRISNGGDELADAESKRRQESGKDIRGSTERSGTAEKSRFGSSGNAIGKWWESEPDVGRVANGIPFRMDRLRGLGNAVVPQCAKEAFRILLTLK